MQAFVARFANKFLTLLPSAPGGVITIREDLFYNVLNHNKLTELTRANKYVNIKRVEWHGRFIITSYLEQRIPQSLQLQVSRRIVNMSTSQVLSSTEVITTILEPKIQGTYTGKALLPDGPAWLTKDYIEECLQKHYDDPCLNIKNISARPALGKGENYGGVLTRIKADFSTGSGGNKVNKGHYIVKTSFEGDTFARETMAPYDIFNREMFIYESVLPKLKTLLKENGDTEQIFAETIMVDYERSALVFEDLSAQEFVMPDRVQGLDMDLTKIILRKLAKMHAASAVLNEREPRSLEGYDRGMFNRHTNNYAPGFEGLFAACARMVAQWGPDFEEHANKLERLKPMYMELGKRVFDPIKGHLNVLAHGDLWTNNVLVKYDKTSGEPQDVIIIDFQYSAWGSPAIDLFYLFNTSLKEEMHISRQEELIEYYYIVLADTLRKLHFGGSIPSLHHFQLQIQEKAFYAFNSTCVIQPVQRNEETANADFNALMKTDERAVEFKNTCYRNPYCQRMIRKLLPVYQRQGLLDPDQ